MATLFEYKCKKCGYSVSATPKGHDMVMMGEIYSYHCEDWNIQRDSPLSHIY